jgi:hypothetical protein
MTEQRATEDSDTVTISLVDSWTEIFGPPGARGMPEAGREVHPPRVHDDDLRDAIVALGREHGVRWKARRSERDERMARFDFGSTKTITDALIAAGGAAAGFGFFRSGTRLLSDWIKARSSRQVVVKFKDGTEVTVQGDNDIEKVYKVYERLHPDVTVDTPAPRKSATAKVANKRPAKKSKAKPKKRSKVK